MTEEPYRWLEAMANRREYVREQLKGGTPVLAASCEEGVVLVGVGTGQSKVFELFDRQALAGLGHPADLEKVRQAAIDAAHLEAFQRAPEDVSLRRLVGFGLGAELKAAFEQVLRAPFLIELILAEVGEDRGRDVLVRLHFDGAFEWPGGGGGGGGGPGVGGGGGGRGGVGGGGGGGGRGEVVERLMQAWWVMTTGAGWSSAPSAGEERRAGWREAVRGREVEVGCLERRRAGAVCYAALDVAALGL